MAYLTNSTQPRLVTNGSINGGAPNVWTMSGTDAVTTLDTANYISDGAKLGMRKGDIVHYVKQTSASDLTPVGYQLFIVIGVTAGAGVDLTDGTAISVTNTD